MTAVRLASLQAFPRLLALFPDESRTKYYQAHQHAPDFIFGILCEEGEECDDYRRELEDALDAGDKLGLLDNQVKGRLASMDSEQFFSAVAELEAGFFLDERGFKVTPAPTGKGDFVGDLQIETTPPIFVEVKATLDRTEEAAEVRVVSGLMRYADPILEQFNDSVIVEFKVIKGAAFARRQLEHWLREVFEGRQQAAVAGTSGDYVFESVQGLRLGMKLHPVDGVKAPAMLSMSERTNPPVAKYFAASIESAHRQLPDDGRPALVVIRSFLSLWAIEKHLRDALFGKEVWDVDFTTKTFSKRHPGGGLLGPGRWLRLSGVGLLNVRRAVGEKTTKLIIHHNPWAQHPLNAESLMATGIYHLVPKEDGKMIWSPPLDEDSG